MGKKGSKRKTRWRTLSIGAPPGEEDEEEGLRNGYVEGQDNDSGTHSFSRNVQSGYKPRRTGSNDGGGTRHKDESSGSPSKPKIIFNEDEYTRITTPRQDMLFKKGYLSRKKPWTGNANTSATSSTTESQSASHSTADGSETTEDQQLLDRDCGTTEYPPMMNSGAQLSYETFYNQVGGFYYEYPAVMVVGPAPMHAAQVAPSVLAAVPCGPVPLRPIEWINPTFVPKLPGQSYCMMNYEANQEGVVVMEEEENAIPAFENSNGTCNESGTGSASYNGSVAGEAEEQPTEVTDTNEEQQVDEQVEEQYGDEQPVEEQPMENGMNGGPYYEPMLMQQPVHMSHVISAVAPPYMYPGHYMFGPPLINVNGVTIQSGPMIRTTDVTAVSPACAKRRKKKKRRKQRRLATGNTEDEEEGEYSSEYETGLPSSRLSWTACPTSTTTSQRPLNPECQEFQLRQAVEPDTSLPAAQTSANNTPTSDKSPTMNQSSTLSSVDNETNEACNGVSSDEPKNRNGELSENANSDQQVASTSTSIESDQSKSLDASTNSDDQANRLTGRPREDEGEAPTTNEAAEDAVEIEKLPSTTKAANSDSSSANEFCERPSNEMNGEALVNGKLDSSASNIESTSKTPTSRPPSPACNDERTRSRSTTPKIAENAITREDQSYESLPSSKSSSSTCLPKRKYSAKAAKFVREPTPGPDLTDSATEAENESKLNDLSQSLEDVDLSNDSKPESTLEPCEDEVAQNDQSSKFPPEPVCNHLSKEDVIGALNEDSGFESQTRFSPAGNRRDYPITQAVTEWLRREKSPDLFRTAISMDCEEDEDEMDEEPPKNLQGNPMPALSANSSADNAELSRAASCGKFARASNNKCGQEQQQQQQQQPESNGGNVLRKKKDAKRRSEERRRVARHVVEGTLDHDVVSSSDSCGQQEDMVNVARRKNSARQQQQQQQQQQDVVGDICEFTETDSVAGMRVALSSRMDSKRINARRTKRQGRTHARDPAINIDTKIRRIEDVDDENDEGIVEDTMNVKTFEKGEIVVSEDGKLLTTTVYDPGLRNRHEAAATVAKVTNKSEPAKQSTERKIEKEKRSSSDEEEESGSAIGSLDSIEEPDVLECWEAEIIEPVITPKRMLQSEGILCDGEATEDDVMEVDQVNVEYVQKYYRLARESATSIEEISLKADPSTSSKSVPNKSEQREGTPTERDQAGDKSNIPIDEAFEVYESCYNGNSPFLAFDSKVFKSRTLYGQDGETPVPCKAVCCRIQ